MPEPRTLLLVDPSGRKRLSDEERGLLPPGEWTIVTPSPDGAATWGTIHAMLLRTGSSMEERQLVRTIVSRLQEGTCLVVNTEADESALTSLLSFAESVGARMTHRRGPDGRDCIRFDMPARQPIHRSGASLGPTGLVLTEAQQDLLSLVFDEAWYLGQHPFVASLIAQGAHARALDYFLSKGAHDGDMPGPLFDPVITNERNERVTFLHYLTRAATPRPCALFDELHYLKTYPDTARAVSEGRFVSGYHHFLKSGYAEGRRPHPIVLPYGLRRQFGFTTREVPRDDWLDILSGVSQPGVLFDAAWYEAMHHAQLVGHGLSPVQHFVRRDLCGRSAPLADFDEEYYRQHNDDMGVVDDIPVHYLYHGIGEERAPNDFFDPHYYLDTNSTVRREIEELGLLGSFEHFLLIGAGQGLRPHVPLADSKVAERDGKALFERRAERIASEVRLGRRIRLPRAERVRISVVIPVVDNFAFTLQLLKQLAWSAPKDTEVILVDAASHDDTRQIETWVENLKVIRLNERASFAANCNRGALEAAGETLVFMNNDISPEPDALANALARLESDRHIGCVGGLILRTHGLVQEAGNVIWSSGATNGIARDAQACDHNLANARDVDMCSACFIAVRRDAFEAIGGFDEAFKPGYCEDADLALRFWQAGHRVVYDPSVVITHFEYGSYSKGRPPGTSAALIVANQKILRRKHASALRNQPAPGSMSTLLAGDRRYRSDDNILLIEDRPPERHLGSGYVRTADVIDGLRAQGHNVVVWARTRGQGQRPPYLDLAGVDLFHADEFPGGLGQFLGENAAVFHTIWVCRTHNFSHYYAELSHWKALHPEAHLIADTEALSAVREIEQMKVLGADTTSARMKLEREVSTLALADRILAVSSGEHTLIRQRLPESDCRRLAHMADWPGPQSASRAGTQFGARKDFGFLGAVHSLESPNLDSILWLCNEAFPRIRERIPGAVLHVAGYFDERIPRTLLRIPEGVRFCGAIEDLDAFFSGIRVFLAPTRFAAGLPQKIATAAAHGVPCVVSPLLHHQIGWGQDTGYVAPIELTPDRFAEAASDLYLDEQKWARVRNAGLELVERDFGKAAFEATLRQATAWPEIRR